MGTGAAWARGELPHRVRWAVPAWCVVSMGSACWVWCWCVLAVPPCGAASPPASAAYAVSLCTCWGVRLLRAWPPGLCADKSCYNCLKLRKEFDESISMGYSLHGYGIGRTKLKGTDYGNSGTEKWSSRGAILGCRDNGILWSN